MAGDELSHPAGDAAAIYHSMRREGLTTVDLDHLNRFVQVNRWAPSTSRGRLSGTFPPHTPTPHAPAATGAPCVVVRSPNCSGL